MKITIVVLALFACTYASPIIDSILYPNRGLGATIDNITKPLLGLLPYKLIESIKELLSTLLAFVTKSRAITDGVN